MRSKSLKVNFNHIREHLKVDYFRYLDVFHKSFLATLIHFTTEDTPLVATTVMENSTYSQLLSEMHSAHQRGSNILELFTDQDKFILIDIQVYLQEFLMSAHNFKEYNIYHLTIDPKYNLVITNKQLGRHAL